MKQLSLLLLLVCTSLIAQESIVKNLGDFSEVKVYRGIKVNLIKAEDAKIEITGKKKEDVTVKNINGILKISMKLEQTFSADAVDVTVFYVNDIKTLDVNEGASISSNEEIIQERLELKAQEAGKITLSLNIKNLTIKSILGGLIRTKGQSNHQDISTGSGGMYDGSDLNSKTTEVSATTGGEANVQASELVQASASVGGVISITGEPDEIEKKESLGGYVRH